MPIVNASNGFRRAAYRFVSGLGLAGLWLASVEAQQLIPFTPNSTAPANGQYVGSYTNPLTGRQYDRYAVQEQLPVQRMEQQEVTERRWVPHWVTETQRTTQTQYIPYVGYQPQLQVANRWNPFAQPQPNWSYTPVTQYQAVEQVVDQPVQYQKYIEQDVKVVIPKLVQTTEARQRFVDVERGTTIAGQAPSLTAAGNASPLAPLPNALQNSGALAMNNRNAQLSNYNLRPMDPWYRAPGAGYPFSPYAAVATVPTNSPYAYSAAYNPTLLPGGGGPVLAMNPMQYASYPTGSTFGGYPASYGAASYPATGTLGYQPYPNNNYYAASPMANWPWSSWSNNQGPLFGRNLFQQNQTAGLAPPPMSGTLYPPANYASVASQTAVTGTLRPSTAPLMPQSNAGWNNNYGSLPVYRDPAQIGLQPTVLR